MFARLKKLFKVAKKTYRVVEITPDGNTMIIYGKGLNYDEAYKLIMETDTGDGFLTVEDEK